MRSALTQEQQRERASKILHSGLVGRITNTEDIAFLVELLARHPAADSKIGCGVDHLEIRQTRYKTPGFWLVRCDGSETDFSYRVCISGAQSHRTLVLAALRCGVADQILDFKTATLSAGARCPLSGEPLDEKCHVDHTPPFTELAAEFVAANGGFEAIAIAPSEDGMIGRKLVDDNIRQRWAQFHRERATLCLLTPGANIQKSARALPLREAAKLAIHLGLQFEYISGRWP